jgi:formylmethanofuran dehydrogenase subunit E
MVKKIKVIDIVNEETINEEPTEAIPDVEQVTVEPVVEQVTVEPIIDEQIPKPKAKTRSRRKQTVERLELPTLEEEPVEEVEATPEIQEEPTEVVEVKEEINKDKVKKVIEQVKCQKCDKMMSSKSLRYTHEQNCKGKVVKTEELPVKRRATNKVEPTTKGPKQEGHI